MTAHDHSAGGFGTRRSPQDTKRRSTYRFRAATVVVALASTALAGTTTTAGASAPLAHPNNAFQQVNLVSDQGGFGADVLVDDNVRNPWGIAMGPHSPLWVSNNFNKQIFDECKDPEAPCNPSDEALRTKITVYKGANGPGPEKVQKVLELKVTASAPTGIVFNPTKSFKVTQNGVKAPATFLFNEVVIDRTDPTKLVDVGEITGWKNGNPRPESTATTKAKNVGGFAGLTIVPAESKHSKVGPRLLAVGQVITVYDGAFKQVKKPGLFVDPYSVKDGFAPYNVAFLKDRVYVAYGTNDETGKVTGGGAVSVFDRNGRFLKRLVTVKAVPVPTDPNSPPPTTKKLDLPWGMAIAPEHWGKFGGALLVGNVESGEISAFNRRNGHLLGVLSDKNGTKLVIPGLWGLAFGNGTIGTPRTLLFAAGIGEEVDGFGEEIYAHGLVGLIKPVNDKH